MARSLTYPCKDEPVPELLSETMPNAFIRACLVEMGVKLLPLLGEESDGWVLTGFG